MEMQQMAGTYNNFGDENAQNNSNSKGDISQ